MARRGYRFASNRGKLHYFWQSYSFLRIMKLPSSAEEGWLRHQKMLRSHVLMGAAGVVLVNRSIFFDQHHPSRRYRVGFPLLG